MTIPVVMVCMRLNKMRVHLQQNGYLFQSRAGLNSGRYPWSRAFTLVEMLVVVVIILVISALVIPAFNALKGSQDMNTAAFDIADTLAQARAYAMGHNTYVFVGFEEVDSAQSTSANPQTAASSTVGGRIAMAIVATKDGTSHYAVTTSNQGSDWQANYASSAAQEYKGGHLMAVNKLLTFDNVHLAASLGTIPITGNMYRPTYTTTASGDSYDLGATACTSATPFSWPLGSSLNSGQYNFTKVIQFDPQGVERITFADSGSAVAQWTEIDLLPTHGDSISQTAPVAGFGSQAAIQINGMTGSARIYRP